MDFLMEKFFKKINETNSAFDEIKRKNWIFFFFPNNAHFQTISLVSNIFKLFRKLTSQVF